MCAENAVGKLYYIYALAEPGLPRRFTVLGQRLQAIDIGRVSAIVEVVRDSPPVTEAALRRQHAVVTRLAERTDALLPVRFGAVFAPPVLDARVKAVEKRVVAALRRVRRCVQMTVRVHAPAARGAAAVPTLSGTAYLAARSERGRALRSVAARIRRVVSRVLVDERVDEGRGELLGTVYHLVRSRDVERYRNRLEAARPSLAPARLFVTGPWPVFAFVPDLDRNRGAGR